MGITDYKEHNVTLCVFCCLLNMFQTNTSVSH